MWMTVAAHPGRSAVIGGDAKHNAERWRRWQDRNDDVIFTA